MESAPKDGREILACWVGEYGFCCIVEYHRGSCPGWYVPHVDVQNVKSEPDFWMPIPKIPKRTKMLSRDDKNKKKSIKVLKDFSEVCRDHAEALSENRIGTHASIFMNEKEAEELANAIEEILS